MAGYFLLFLHFAVVPLLFFSSLLVPLSHGSGPCVLLVDLKVDWIRRLRRWTPGCRICYVTSCFNYGVLISFCCGCDDEQVKLRIEVSARFS